MDIGFYKNYFKYFLWNKVLFKHFFSDKKKEILLYTDEILIEKLGKLIIEEVVSSNQYREDVKNQVKEDLTEGSCMSDFFSSVENFCKKNNYLTYIQNIEVQGDSISWCKRRRRCNYYNDTCKFTDPLLVAKHILEKKYFDKYENESGEIKIGILNKKASFHDLPFLGIVIYLILKIDNGETQEWNNIDNNVFQIRENNLVKDIWGKLSELTDGRFNSEASIYNRTEENQNEDYIGRILYHLPLKASIRNRICDAIYKSGVWEKIDVVPFSYIYGKILNSLDETTRRSIIPSEAFLRKFQTVVEDFDIVEYKSKIEERKRSEDYALSYTKGEFALGIQFIDERVSIVLLTSIDVPIKSGDFNIKEGNLTLYGGYNTNLVEYKGSISVNLQDYTLNDRENRVKISPIGVNEVVFFYQPDASNNDFYLQTKEIKPSPSYFIAVKKKEEAINKFKEWCKNNSNAFENLMQCPSEETDPLFGKEWIIFYTDHQLNGQYYKVEESNATDIDFEGVILSGGIKKENNTYFVNALPYFEISEKINGEEINLLNVEIYINIEGKLFENYTKIIKDRRIILDFNGLNLDVAETKYVDISFEYSKKGISESYSFNIVSQLVDYQEESIYKFNEYGVKIDTNDYFYKGNDVIEKYRKDLHQRKYYISQIELNEDRIDNDCYFINLLSAVAYKSQEMEITYETLKKCIRYSATRMGIEIDGYLYKDVRDNLVKVGVLQRDYNTNKYQVIPPAFINVPFSVYGTNQQLLLSGCYTKAFVLDLINYCSNKRVKIYTVQRNENSLKVADKFLPPTILLGSNFDSTDYRNKTNHSFDIINYDFALSLFNIIPNYSTKIKPYLNDFRKGDEGFVNILDKTNEELYPRIRKCNNNRGYKDFYIESEDKEFVKIENSLLPWATLFCKKMQKGLMVVIDREKVYVPKDIYMPNYVQRALYLMNLGFPIKKKVYIAGVTQKYYTEVDYYNLYSEEGCKQFALKIAEVNEIESSTNLRSKINNGTRMQLWKEKYKGGKHRNMYLVLMKQDNLIAIAFKPEKDRSKPEEDKFSIFLKIEDDYYKVSPEYNVPEVIEYLIKNKSWRIKNNAIAESRDMGNSFIEKYRFNKVVDDEISQIIDKQKKEELIVEYIEII